MFFAADSPGGFYLGRFIQGAGEAPVWALGPALLSLAYPHAKGKVIGIYNAAIHSGLTVGPLLGLFLFPAGRGSLPFLLFAALCLAGGMTVLLFLPPASAAPRQSGGEAPRLRALIGLFRQPAPRATLSGILLYGAGYGVFVSVLPASLAVSKGFDNQAIGIFFALFYVAISIAQLIAGPLSDRQGRQRYMIAGLVMAAGGFASFAAFPYPWTYVPLTLAGFGLGIFCVASMAYLNDCVPLALKGSISGSYYLAWGLGYLSGPLVVAQLDDWAGYHLLALLMAAHTLLLWRASSPRAWRA